MTDHRRYRVVPELFLGSMNVAPAIASVAPKRVVFIPTAANPLPDRQEAIDAVRRQLAEPGRSLIDVDPERGDDLQDAGLESGDLLTLGGGDPFHLIEVLRDTGTDHAINTMLDHGVRYLGVSAGAIVAGPSLEPLIEVSPFTPPDHLPLNGLGIAPVVVLPHDDRPGRSTLHASAVERFKGRHTLVAISDTQVVAITADGRWNVLGQHDSAEQ